MKMKKTINLLLSVVLILSILATLEISTEAAKKKSAPTAATYSAVFNATFYANKYPDLKTAYGNNANALFNHFYNSGMAEGRQGSEEFEVHAYMNRYADLRSAFGKDLRKYYNHYVTTGKAEGRNGRPSGNTSSTPSTPKKNLPTKPSTLMNGSNNDFTKMAAYNAKGQLITGDIFTQYDLTMVNCWTTWCGYCVREMPGLEDLSHQLPSNVNMISICFDSKDNPSGVDRIIRDNGITFQVLLGDKAQCVPFSTSSLVSGWPTTLYIDRNGKLVYKSEGAPRNPVSGYMSNINYALSLIGK